MMGEGDLPIDDMMLALRSINYDGYISLEWVKRWATDLSDAGVVFPHYANFIGGYLEKQTVRGRLFDNKARTGKYIWEKDTLIDLTFPQVLDRVVEEFPHQYAFRYTTWIIPYLLLNFEDVTPCPFSDCPNVKPGDRGNLGHQCSSVVYNLGDYQDRAV